MKPMNKTLLALLVSAVSMGAYAEGDEVKTKGGFQIKSEDGLFEAKIGGRIHLDGNYFTQEDHQAKPGTPDISADKQDANSTLFLRRAYLTLTGRAYDFEYKFENDFAAQSGNSGSGFREMWIMKKVEGHNVRLGQAKPYRGMEELTSSNEIDFMERPFATASGIYTSGRQFQTGVFVDNVIDNFGYGASIFQTRTLDSTQTTEGRGYNGRVYYVPIQEEGTIVHVGTSFTAEDTPLVTTAASTNGDIALNGAIDTISVRAAGRNNGLQASLLQGATKNRIFAGEFAVRHGQFYLQSEFAQGKFDAVRQGSGKGDYSNTANAGVVDLGQQDVSTYYVQGSYMLTDHYKPYDFKKGVFKSPKISGGEGAIELRARFDVIQNKDFLSVSDVTSASASSASPIACGSSGGSAATSSAPATCTFKATATPTKVTQITLGATYFPTPNTRFMLEYVDGKVEEGNLDKKAALVQARAQFNF